MKRMIRASFLTFFIITVIIVTNVWAPIIKFPVIPEKEKEEISDFYIYVLSSDNSIKSAEVTAGPDDSNVDKHTPGVCFYPYEWNAPTTYMGKMCRYAPVNYSNFLINNPWTNNDYEIKITYWSKNTGYVQQWTGSAYQNLGTFSKSSPQDSTGWRTDSYTAKKEWFSDYMKNIGVNTLFQFSSPIYVHKISVKCIGEMIMPAEEVDTSTPLPDYLGIESHGMVTIKVGDPESEKKYNYASSGDNVNVFKVNVLGRDARCAYSVPGNIAWYEYTVTGLPAGAVVKSTVTYTGWNDPANRTKFWVIYPGVLKVAYHNNKMKANTWATMTDSVSADSAGKLKIRIEDEADNSNPKYNTRGAYISQIDLEY